LYTILINQYSNLFDLVPCRFAAKEKKKAFLPENCFSFFKQISLMTQINKKPSVKFRRSAVIIADLSSVFI